MNYKAFISYSHSADDKLAPALQSALHRFAKPFYRLRAIKVFRDKTSLRLTPELWPLIQQALASSEYFLLMCSPEAARSHWVQNEVAEWLRLNGNADKLLLVLTEGEIVWDDVANDFDWQRTNALPENLRQVFSREPLYSDLRWARKATDLSLRNPQFLDEIGSLGATLHGRPKDEMIGNDVRQHRLFKSISAAAIVILIALTALASGAAVYANKQKNEAVRQTVEAQRQRRTALEAAERERQAAARERQAAESEKIARQNEENQRKKAEQATKNETTAKNQAEDRRREAERERQIADDRRREAERQQNLATSRELAASADSQLSSDPELSLLLSLKAHDRTPTAEAENSLRRSLLNSRVRATFKTLNWYQTTYSPDGKWLILLSSVAEVVEPGTWRVVNRLKGPGRWNSVEAVSFSQDGKLLLTISYNLDDKQSTVRLWEVGTWQIKTELAVAENHELTRARLSPDGKFAVTWSPLTRIWNLATHESITLGGSTPGVNSEATFSPDGKFVTLVEGERGKSFARVWDSANGRLIYQSDVDVALTTYEVPISPDSKHIAVISSDNNVRIIKTGSWQTVATLGIANHRPRLATFSPDGKYLATAGDDRTIHIWNTESWRGEFELRGHTGRLEKVRFSNDGKVLVSSSKDGSARAWEAGTWRLLAVLQGGHTRPLHDIAVSPEGRYVVTTATDSLARVWDLGASVEEVTVIDAATDNGVPEQVPTVYNPDGTLLATNGDNGVEVWTTATHSNVANLGRGNFLGFSPDGKHAFTTRGKLIQMWDTGTWQKTADLRGQNQRVMGLAFSSDGRFVVTTGDEIDVWQADTGLSVTVLKQRSWRVVFSPDNKWMAGAIADGTVSVWEVGTWREVIKLRGHTAWVRGINFNFDGTRLVTSGEDQTARVWETGSWRTIAVLQGHTDRVDEVCFSPDGRYVLTASGDNTARLWETETGKSVAVLTGHTASVDSARFSPDGLLIATAGDTTVHLWNGTTGKPVKVLQVFTEGTDSSGLSLSVKAATFSPDGRSLLVSGSNRTTRIYSWAMFAPLEDLLLLGRTRVTRELTADEKRRYLHEVIDDKQRLNQ